ncbi:MAG: hypothetical protein EXR79_02380 [Myxococcales bacterium]|nr:hypothetical protein [Myxococcales bacterium]
MHTLSRPSCATVLGSDWTGVACVLGSDWTGVACALAACTLLGAACGTEAAKPTPPDATAAPAAADAATDGGGDAPAKADAQPPTVAFTAPKAGALVTGTVSLQVAAQDDVGVTRVRFFANGGLLFDDATAPFAHEWASTDADDGTYVLTAVASDAAGNTATASVQVTLDRTAPKVVFAAPAEKAMVGDNVNVAVTVTEAGTLEALVFSAAPSAKPDGAVEIGKATVGNATIDKLTAVPYSVTWNTTGLAAGAYVLTANATDKAGNKASAARNVQFDRLPTVTLTAPVANASLSGVVKIAGSAEDDVGIASGELRIDGKLVAKLVGGGKSAPIQANWDTTLAAYGAHTLAVDVTDSAGQAASVMVKVTLAAVGTPGMVLIPAGNFFMGCNAAKDTACQTIESPQHEVKLNAFELDVTEVTVEAYQACIAAGKCPTLEDVGPSCNLDVKQKAAKAGHGKHPINCVKWFYANAYCGAVGKRLPTEAEWEMAARGDCTKNGGAAGCAVAMRTYVWGDAWPPPPGSGNFADVTAAKAHPDWTTLASFDDGHGESAPVGGFSTNVYGLHDMAGNVSEWVADIFVKAWYGQSPASNPLATEGSWFRSYRGGSFYVGQGIHLRASRRGGIDPAAEDFYLGFRCAKSQ